MQIGLNFLSINGTTKSIIYGQISKFCLILFQDRNKIHFLICTKQLERKSVGKHGCYVRISDVVIQ